MKQIIPTILGLTLSATSLLAQSQKKNIDFSWKFAEGNTQTWTNTDLPHDWDIYHAPSIDAATGNDGGYYPGGTGTYMKEFKDTELKTKPGETLWIHFEGVYHNCTVSLNDKEIGKHAYGYTPFKVEITPYVQKGINRLVVKVDNSEMPNCRWYTGSGIYRHVWLERYDEQEMDDPEKLFITTEKIYGVNKNGTHADSASIHITYDDKLDETRMMRDVDLWSPEQPKLYDITVGELTIKHGIRTFSYDAKNGFILNGKPMLINGACVHHDHGIIGAMAFDAAEIRKVRLMKQAGFNLIRTSHNLQTRAMLDACDSIGMMVIDEIYDGWYTEKTKYDHHIEIDSCYKEDIRAMVLRDRNHPSIISWSIGNEVIERKEIRVVQTASKFKAEIKAYDTTRPVTEALCAWDSDWEIYDPHAAVLDIVGYNYMMHKAESDHERCPERVMWQTESFPRDAFNNWKHTTERTYIIGDMVWTGLDYIGESGIGQFYHEGEIRGEHYWCKHFPFHGAYCGDVDITGWRKPISHYRDMLWNAKDGDNTIYMAVKEPNYYENGEISESSWSVWPTWESWNWKGWEGKDVEVELYTKAPQVRLYLNDKVVATQDVNIDTQYKATIKIPYQPGTLRAVAIDANGKEGATTTLKTSSKPASIRLTADKEIIEADGEDLCYVTMEVVDENGIVVPDAALTAIVEVKGAGKLLAAASASFKDLEPKTSPKVTTYRGRALIAVRSNQKKGKITISAKSEQGINGTILITCK